MRRRSYISSSWRRVTLTHAVRSRNHYAKRSKELAASSFTTRDLNRPVLMILHGGSPNIDWRSLKSKLSYGIFSQLCGEMSTIRAIGASPPHPRRHCAQRCDCHVFGHRKRYLAGLSNHERSDTQQMRDIWDLCSLTKIAVQLVSVIDGFGKSSGELKVYLIIACYVLLTSRFVVSARCGI
jgi:hypothetical protein